MDKLCLIVSGGAFAPLPEDLPAPDFVIACDRGWRYAERLGVAPDLIVGDFDSAAAPDTSVPVERLPTRKDDTDTMYAARRAVALGGEPFGSPTLSDQALMPFPSMKMGPGESSRSHTADEYITEQEIHTAIPLYLQLIDGFSF